MSKPINRKTVKIENYRTYRITPPTELEPLYDKLQALEDTILTTKKYRDALLQLDPHAPRGEYWLALKDIIRPEVRKLDIVNKTWYAHNVMENLRQVQLSLLDKQTAYDLLEANDWKADSDFSKALDDAGINLAPGAVRSLLKSRKRPELPQHDTFVLDYSISAAQNFTIYEDDPLTAYIQRDDGEWLAYKVNVPDWVLAKPGFTGQLTKPRFRRDKTTHEFVGEISYGLDETAHDLASNAIMGVDLGRLKLYSAVVVYPDGSYSEEMVHSHELELDRLKLDRLWGQVNALKAAIQRCKVECPRQGRRKTELERVKGKIGRLKDSMARQEAVEIVSEAIRRGVREVHVEYLSWLDATGGSWDHARVQDYLREECEEHGVTFVKVSAWNSSRQHPVTGEVGSLHDREVRFESDPCIDRDLLAALNLAQRSGKRRSRGRKMVKPVRVARVRVKHTATPRRLRAPRKKRRFPLVTRVDHNSFNVEGRGVIVASLPVQRHPRAGARGRWVTRGVTPVSSDMVHRVTLSNYWTTSN